MNSVHPDEFKTDKATRPVALAPKLAAFVRALARIAAREDYDRFCRTGGIVGLGNGMEDTKP